MLETILILEQRVQRETIHGSNAPGGTGQGTYELKIYSNLILYMYITFIIIVL